MEKESNEKCVGRSHERLRSAVTDIRCLVLLVRVEISCTLADDDRCNCFDHGTVAPMKLSNRQVGYHTSEAACNGVGHHTWLAVKTLAIAVAPLLKSAITLHRLVVGADERRWGGGL